MSQTKGVDKTTSNGPSIGQISQSEPDETFSDISDSSNEEVPLPRLVKSKKLEPTDAADDVLLDRAARRQRSRRGGRRRSRSRSSKRTSRRNMGRSRSRRRRRR